MVLNALFPDNATKEANIKQRQIMFNQLALGANLFNKGTNAAKAVDAAYENEQKLYSEKVFNAELKIQGKVLKGTEDLARRLATSSKVGLEAGRSRRYGANLGMMAYSKQSQMENMARFTAGEGASATINTGAIKLASDLGKAYGYAGVGVGAKQGVTFTPRNQWLDAVKLAAQIGTGNWGGAFGQMADGGNASMFQWLGGDGLKEGTGWLFNRA